MNTEKNIYSSNEERSFQMQSGIASFFNKVFLLMMLGIFLTFAVAYGIVYFAPASTILFVAQNYYLFLFAELAVVLFLRFRVMKMSSFGVTVSFMIYAILTGFTFVVFCLAYGSAIFTSALLTTSGYFLILTVVGFITKKDLSNTGNMLRTSLIAIIILSLINLFFYSSIVDLFIIISTLLIFTGFTIYDIKTLKNVYLSASSQGEIDLSKVAVYGALTLYLDFINLFLSILRLIARFNDANN